jgi:hypothetical protein
MYVILPANKTVVSGYNSAMGGLERYELVFRAPMLHNRVCSWGYSLSRTLDGNKDEIMAFDLLAVETMYSCCRETFQSYSINTKKGNTSLVRYARRKNLLHTSGQYFWKLTSFHGITWICVKVKFALFHI